MLDHADLAVLGCLAQDLMFQPVYHARGSTLPIKQASGFSPFISDTVRLSHFASMQTAAEAISLWNSVHLLSNTTLTLNKHQIRPR